jgi:hypothetical protein
MMGKSISLAYILFVCEAERAYNFMIDGGKKKMDYNLFSEFMKQFILIETQGHPVSLGLDK